MLINIFFYGYSNVSYIFHLLLEMYKSYQIQLVLVHAQTFFTGLMAYVDLVMDVIMFLLKSAAFGKHSVNYLNLIPWFPIIQLYVLLIPKTVSNVKFHLLQLFFFYYGLKMMMIFIFFNIKILESHALMCIIYFGNIFDVVIILKNILTVCNDSTFENYSCSTIKLLRENPFFIITFTLSKYLIILFTKRSTNLCIH